MIPAALPPDEAARLKALQQLAVLDTPAEVAFDARQRDFVDLLGDRVVRRHDMQLNLRR